MNFKSAKRKIVILGLFLVIFGFIPLLNIIPDNKKESFESRIDYNELNNPDGQMNYVPEQMSYYDYSWNTLNLTGDSNASIAILSSGVDITHRSFGNTPFEDKNFDKQIIGWQDYIEVSNIIPKDPNGLGTFLTQTAFGPNSTESNIILDAWNRTVVTLGGVFYHPNEFKETWQNQDYFNIKLGTLRVLEVNSNITVNCTFKELEGDYIQNAQIQLLFNGATASTTQNTIENVFETINYNISTQTGNYDVNFRYRSVGFPNPANFSVLALVNVTLEDNFENVSYLCGIAPDSKIISMRTINEEAKGVISDVVSALTWIQTNAVDYQIVAVTISLGSYSWDVTDSVLETAINSLIDDGIMVIIATGDNGVGSTSINRLAKIKNAIVVGSVNELNQLTYYSSEGMALGSSILKPDILAPGGSKFSYYRGIIGADSNENDNLGSFSDDSQNDTTSKTGTSISAAFVAAAYNNLIEAIGGYDSWKLTMNKENALSLKAFLLMTATETNRMRENDPTTSFNEASSAYSPTLNRGGKDVHEGYGILNIDTAVEALLYNISVNSITNGSIISSVSSPNGKHAFARQITLEKNKSYNFTLTHDSSTADLDLYLYFNVSSINGEPLLLRSSTQPSITKEAFIIGMVNETQNYVVVIKAISGGLANFNLTISELINNYAPQLSDASVESLGGYDDILDTFRFIVNYTDKDNIPPLTIYLNITGASTNISLIKYNSLDNNYTDGCLYYVDQRFYEAGDYEYHFGVSDGNNFTRLPTGTSNSILTVLPMLYSEFGDYSTDFSDITNWIIEDDWYQTSQLNSLDYRGEDAPSLWHALYWGENDSVADLDYNYASTTPIITHYAYSPQMWIEPVSNPVLTIGGRISINNGDNFYVDARGNRTGSWTNLVSYTNIEQDWTYQKIDLSAYKGRFVQIRFRVVKDIFPDNIRYKGIMIDNFKLYQQGIPNSHSSELFNTGVTPTAGNKYQEYQYSTVFCDADGIPPELVYIELNGQNRTMFNIYGDWDALYSKFQGLLLDGGILYTYNTSVALFSSTSFKIHYRVNGIWYKTSSITGPTLTSSVPMEFPFDGNIDYITTYGNPQPNSDTLWVDCYNSIHFIDSTDTWYTGTNYNGGYGTNWNVNLVLPLMTIPTLAEEAFTPFLFFNHQLIFDGGIQIPDFPPIADEYAQIFVSTNLGQTWILVTEYLSDIDDYETVKLSLGAYRGKSILIRFFFHSDQFVIGSTANMGWFIRNIKVDIDPTQDLIPPTVTFLDLVAGSILSGEYTLNIQLEDPSGIYDSKTVIYLGTHKLTGVTSINGFVECIIDTTELDNKNYTITVIGYDLEGNKVTSTLEITIYNYVFPWWIIWIIVISAIITIAIVILFIYQKDNQYKREAESLIINFNEMKDFRSMNWWLYRAYNKARRRKYEQEVRSEAEASTDESEAKKPFILYCKKCHKWFKNMQPEWECPVCYHDSLQIAYHCKLCDKWYFKEEPHKIGLPGEYMCKKCKIRLLK